MAVGSKEIQRVLNAVDEGLITFNEAIPAIQEQIYRRLLRFQKELIVQGDTITNSVKNIQLLSSLKSDLEDIILNDTDYLESVTKLGKLYEKVDTLNYSYFKALEKKFKPPKVMDAIRKQSVSILIKWSDYDDDENALKTCDSSLPFRSLDLALEYWAR